MQFLTDHGEAKLNQVKLPKIYLNPRDRELKSRMTAKRILKDGTLSNVQSLQHLDTYKTVNLDSEQIRNYKSR